MKQLNINEFGLGRLPAIDNRDRLFHMASVIPAVQPELTKRYWNAEGWWGDQGFTSQCVAYSWTHWLEDGPTTHKGNAPIISPADLYNEAQKVDEWEGEAYDGTSVRAGAKVLQSKGHIKEYRWCWDVDTLVHALLTTGPVAVGTDWHLDMFNPDSTGLIKPTGPVMGGHAYVINGVNKKTGLLRIKNSWGRGWGKKGFAYIKFSDFAKLLNNYGECCLAVENKTS